MSLLAGAYSDIAIRSISDADLLVRCKDVDKVEKILSAVGFRRYATTDISTFSNELCFEKDEITRIELRWNMTHHDRFRLLSHLNFDDIFSNSIASSLNGVEIRVPSPEQQLLLATFHLSLVHHFSRRIWLYDIVVITDLYKEEMNWLEVVCRASGYHLKTALYYSIYRAGAEFNESLLTSEIESIRPSKCRMRLLNWSIKRNYVYVVELLLLDRFRDVAKYIFGIIYPSRDWLKNHYKIHRTMFYRLAHPFIIAISAATKFLVKRWKL